ncbi:acetyl-CoA carboxylase, biotin carboxyl carrier protein [Coprobacillus sp. AF21-8LB]|nr:acetyl-CoA carboxylase, biotin carboxyl carrier protein [Coprobacillus sp. AF21-8LB]
MKLDFIKQIMSEFDQSNVTKMKVEIDDLKIELEKESEKVEYVKPVEKEVIEDKQIKQEQATGTAVKSPIVGVFYSASSPESEPYVTVGKNVKKGDIVCIIEAMKVMNEIKAPCDGTVTSILVENEALVEYDQALMVIE